MLGVEFALAAVIVSASIAKERNSQVIRTKLKGGGELAKASEGTDVEIAEVSTADDNSNQIPKYQDLKRPSWLVRPNEDLVKLAEHLFQEGAIGWLIADLNVGKIKETLIESKRVVELRSRQRIDLPVWQDIVQFHNDHNQEIKPENLITIVTQTAIDTELMNSALAGAMGVAPTSTSDKPAAKPVERPIPSMKAPVPSGVPPTPSPTPITSQNAPQTSPQNSPRTSPQSGPRTSRPTSSPTPTPTAQAPVVSTAFAMKVKLSNAKEIVIAARRVAQVMLHSNDNQRPTGGAAVTEEAKALAPKYA